MLSFALFWRLELKPKLRVNINTIHLNATDWRFVQPPFMCCFFEKKGVFHQHVHIHIQIHINICIWHDNQVQWAQNNKKTPWILHLCKTVRLADVSIDQHRNLVPLDIIWWKTSHLLLRRANKSHCHCPCDEILSGWNEQKLRRGKPIRLWKNCVYHVMTLYLLRTPSDPLEKQESLNGLQLPWQITENDKQVTGQM